MLIIVIMFSCRLEVSLDGQVSIFGIKSLTEVTEQEMPYEVHSLPPSEAVYGMVWAPDSQSLLVQKATHLDKLVSSPLP